MAGLRLPTCAKCNGPANGPKDLRPAQFTDLSIDCRVAWLARRWVCGRAGDELVPGMGLCRGKADWPCGVQTVSSRTAQWSGMWPAAFARHDAVLAAGRNAPVLGICLCREWACAGVRLIGLAACKPEVHARLSGAACGPLRLPGMMPCWPLAAMRLYLEFAYAGYGPVPGIRPVSLAACKPEVHARLSGRHVARCVCPS